MPLTSQTKNNILQCLAGKTYMLGGTIYVGLSSTAPNADGTNITEPPSTEETGYKRVLIGSYNQSATQKFGDPENFVIANDEEIYFPESKGSWGAPLTHFVLFSEESGSSASSVVAYEKLTDNDGADAPISVTTDKTVVMFRPGKLKVSLAD